MRWSTGWMVVAAVMMVSMEAGAAPFAWIANQGSNSVSRIDLATNLSVTTAVGEAPAAVAPVPDGSRTYVANGFDGTISVVDGFNVTTLGTIQLTANPQGVAVTPNGAKLYVTRNDGNVDVIDTTTADISTTIALGPTNSFLFAYGITVNPAGSHAYVAKFEDNTASIAVIDTATDQFVSDVFLSVDGNFPLSVTVSPDGSRVYSTAMNIQAVRVVDATTNLLIDEVPLSCPTGCTFMQGVVANHDGSLVYVSMPEAVAVVDTATLTEIGTIPLPSTYYWLDITPDGSRLYAVDINGGITIIDTATSTIIGTLLAVGESPIGFGRFIVPGPTTTTTTSTSSTSTSSSSTTSTSSSTSSSTTSSSTTSSSTSTSTSTTSSTSSSSSTSTTVTSTTTTTSSTTPTTTTTSSTSTTTIPPVPVLSGTARACQTAIAGSWKKFPAKIHKLFTGCFDRVLRDVASGTGTANAAASCLQQLNPASTTSSLARARIAARAQLLGKCGTLTPSQVANPCSPTAGTMPEVADCVLDRQADYVAATVAAEYGASCSIATAAGLTTLFPTLCGP